MKIDDVHLAVGDVLENRTRPGAAAGPELQNTRVRADVGGDRLQEDLSIRRTDAQLFDDPPGPGTLVRTFPLL